MFQIQESIPKGSKVFDISESTDTWFLPCYQIKSLADLFRSPCEEHDSIAGRAPMDYCRTCYRSLESKRKGGFCLNTLENLLKCSLPYRSRFEYDDRFCSSRCFCKAHFMFRMIATKCGGDISLDLMNFWNERLSYRAFDKTDASILVTTCVYFDFSTHEKFLSKLYDESSTKKVEESISEYWILLYPLLPDVRKSSSYRLLTDLAFQRIVNCIHQRCFIVKPNQNPIDVIIDSLFKSTDDVTEKLNGVLTEFKKGLPGCNTLYESFIQNGVSEDLAAWRTISRVSQGLQEDMLNDAELRSELNSDLIHTIEKIKHPLILISPYLKFSHSCLPNSLIEINGSVVSLIALYNIYSGETISVSYIDNLNANCIDRGNELKNILGDDFTCECVRCKIERSVQISIDIGSNSFSFQWFHFKRMGDFSMQNSHFKEAEIYYKLALSMDGPGENEKADIVHAEAASLLEQGKFSLAHEKWKDAASKFPYHKEIHSQVIKSEKYTEPDCELCTGSDNIIFFDTLIPFKCFLTRNSVISQEECRQAIQWAEEASLSLLGGWTTSRHYAVPTTDIPIHQIPNLLTWFNRIFFRCLRPLLAQQFGEQYVGIDGCNVYIHDAFIVRYDSTGGQRHLPLHRDESTHSFTIALNSVDEYEGGGTYISELKSSLRPNQGDILSFRGGNLLHGGDPILKGTRYIIVAFCYTELKGMRKRKLFDDANTSNFSFGFQI